MWSLFLQLVTWREELIFLTCISKPGHLKRTWPTDNPKALLLCLLFNWISRVNNTEFVLFQFIPEQ